MSEVRKLSKEEIEARKRKPRQAGQDLTPYIAMLEPFDKRKKGEEMGELILGPEEQQRQEKFRLTRAATQLGFKLRYRKAEDADGHTVIPFAVNPIPGKPRGPRSTN